MPAGETAYGRIWAGYQCTTCGDVVSAKGKFAQPAQNAVIDEIYPGMRSVNIAVPDRAHRYLEQAYESLHTPDAAAVMAGSAVDAMLKDKGDKKGTLNERIDQAVANHLLTTEMGEWAHEGRLGSNRPRHADDENPHVTPEEAAQSVEFADALAEFLFVLPARIEKGLRNMGGAEGAEGG